MSNDPHTRDDTVQSGDNSPPVATEGEFVDPDDLKVTRDGDGARVGTVMEAGTFGKVKVLPMNYGDVNEYFGSGAAHDVEADILADVFTEFIVKPDLGVVTGDDVRAMKPLAPRDLMLAIFDASGIDAEVAMQGGGDAHVEIEGN